MATFHKRRAAKSKTGYRWRARVRRGGFEVSKNMDLKADAEEWAREIERLIDKGEWAKVKRSTDLSFGKLVEEYLDEVKPSTDYRRQLNWWRDQLGDLAVADVSRGEIARLRQQLSRGKTARGRRSSSTVNRYLAALSVFFSWAVEREYTASHPVKGLKRMREPRLRVRFLDDDERTRLLEACQRSAEPRLYPLVVLALASGARRGELLGLRWKDVDLKRGVAVLENTKNRERRALPLASLALDELRRLSKVRRIDSDLVFAPEHNAALFPRKAWEKALTDAEIADFRFHDLRHSAASELAMSGATLAEIAEVLGHKTLAMVKRYSHLTEQHTSKVVARMNERIFGGS